MLRLPGLVLLALAALSRPDAAPAFDARLDGTGRMMLDPLRDRGLHVAALVERLHLRPSDTVADVGAGPGFLTLPLARAVPTGRVIATDVDGSYLAVAADRAARAGLANVETRVVARDAPGLDRASIDLALVCQVDQYVPDRVAWLRALVPSLRPHGRVAIVNSVRHRAAALAAARDAGLRLVDEWSPSPPYYLAVFEEVPR